ncbi:MAG TPA: hypothetical protein VMK42_10130 [Anaeromyxobacteraceae bacterium]|nr:hypothetical protein [Anaeromyxobacteraceae bacterium]
MRRFFETALLLSAAHGLAGCNLFTHDVTLSLSTPSSDPIHVQNQCLTGTGTGSSTTVAVCPQSSWGATGAACAGPSALCPCTSYFTTPASVTIDPSQNSTFNSNKSKIQSVTLNNIEINGTASSNGFTNHATELTGATIVLTDSNNPGAPETFTLTQTINLLGSNTYDPSTAFTPDPSSFLTNEIKNGNAFTVSVLPSTSATIDICPIDIDFEVTLSVTLKANLL